MEFHDRLIARMKALNIKATDICAHPKAKEQKISKANVSQWKAGKSIPSLAKGVALAQVLGTTSEFLMGKEIITKIDFDEGIKLAAGQGSFSVTLQDNKGNIIETGVVNEAENQYDAENELPALIKAISDSSPRTKIILQKFKKALIEDRKSDLTESEFKLVSAVIDSLKEK